MATLDGGSERVSGSFEPISVAVTEYVAARRLGLSVDTLRRDRRTGHFGIPHIKLGEGKTGLVRYDLADLERWIKAQKWVGRAQAPQAAPQVAQPPVAEPAKQPVEPAPELKPAEPPMPAALRMPSRPAGPWDAMIPRADDDDGVDPFATAGRSAPRRQGSGYWGH